MIKRLVTLVTGESIKTKVKGNFDIKWTTVNHDSELTKGAQYIPATIVSRDGRLHNSVVCLILVNYVHLLPKVQTKNPAYGRN